MSHARNFSYLIFIKCGENNALNVEGFKVFQKVLFKVLGRFTGTKRFALFTVRNF